MRRWSPLLAALKDVRAAKIRTRQLVRTAGLPLEPGLWVFHKRSGMRHWREPRPQPLRSGIDGRLVTVEAGWRFLVSVWPPYLVVVRGRGHGARRVLTSKDGSLIAIDTAAGAVHHAAAAPFPPDYERRRDEVADYLPAPGYRLWPDRARLTEDLVAGEPFAAQSLDVKRRVLADLITRSVARTVSSEAIEAFGAGHVGDDIEEALDLARRAPLPDWLAADVEDFAARLSEACPRWPVIVGHGDMTGANILVRPGPVWTTIDFEDARPVPFCYDALSLVLRDVDLRRCLRAEDGLPELDGLWASGDDSTLNTNLGLRVTALLGIAHHATRHGGTPQDLVHVWPRR